MPGTSASQLIFFIAAVMVASAVAGMFVATTLNLSKDIKRQADQQANSINTQVQVINDPSVMPYNASASTLVLLVMNTGSNLIAPNMTRVILDGNYSASDNLTFRLLDGASSWANGVTLEITIGNVTLSSGDHQVKVIVEWGRTVTFPFKI